MTGVTTFLSQYWFEIVSSIGIIGALVLSAWQNFHARKALRAQSFLNLHQLEVLAHGKDGEDGIVAITTLNKYDNFAEFEQNEPASKREAIYNAVAFLNFVATLGEEDYLKIQDGWDVYFMAYRISYDKLLPWWLEYQRQFHHNIFPSFERACLVIHAITPEMSIAFDNKRIGQYEKRYYRTSKLTKEKLHNALNQSGVLRYTSPSKPS
jgi:hypothetical protein